MNQQLERHPITTRKVVYQMPGMETVQVRSDVEFPALAGNTLTMHIYYPASPQSRPAPVVVFVLGYSDAGFQAKLGCKQEEMSSYISWAQLTAASGLAAITYTTNDPPTDIAALLDHLRSSGKSLGIDASRLGVWACSGSAPTALSLLMRDARQDLRCAALSYPILMDVAPSTRVIELAKVFGFANPVASRSIDDLADDVPLLIVRAGKDETPRLNETMDRFLGEALKQNLPITLVNHPQAPHAFDLMDDGERTREIIGTILEFMKLHLLG